MTEQKGPTLTDAKGMGGIIALDGFDYQVWSALALLPSWLRNPCFEGFVVEMLEDYEARFFAPHSPHKHLLERFQAKSGVQSKQELSKIFESFAEFNEVHPGIARVQTLVTPSLPPALGWLSRDSGRIRRARPFYRPFSEIRIASEDKFRNDLINEFGERIGCFISDYVEFDIKSFPDRSHAEIAFSHAVDCAFPDIDVNNKVKNSAFSMLLDLVGNNRGKMLAKDRLLQVLSEEFRTPLISDRKLRVHILSMPNESELDAIEIDATDYSGGDKKYPTSDLWHSGLLVPLDNTARWAREGKYHQLALTGNFRLSTALALGWSFRSVKGFEIEISTRSGIWATADYPLHGVQGVSWEITVPERLVNGRLVVAIGVLRDPSLDIQYSHGILRNSEILTAFLPKAVSSEIETQQSVGILKDVVALTVSKLHPTGIDLFFAGPSALAVALGHRWNAFPSTQVYEFISSDCKYFPTVILE